MYIYISRNGAVCNLEYWIYFRGHLSLQRRTVWESQHIIMLHQTLLVALAAGLALASPIQKREVPASHRVHERHLPHWSTQWTKRSKVPSSEVLPMRIGLKQSNLEAGRERLLEM